MSALGDTPPNRAAKVTPATQPKETPKDAAPKRRGRPPGAKTTPRPALTDRLTEQFVMVGMLVCAANENDGLAIIDGAPRLAESLDKLARQKPEIRRALERLLSASAYGEVMMAAMAIVIPVAINHAALPSGLASRMGIVYPGARVGTSDPQGDAPQGSGPDPASWEAVPAV